MFKKDSTSEYVEEQLANGLIKKYVKGRTLGKGGFAECYEFISEETGRHYAAKVIEKESLGKGKAKEKLESEITIHKALRHQHIVKFEHFFEDHEYVYILLELCTNNTLNELLKRRKILTELETKYYTLQLLLALTYIQQNRVIHRDLKLGNFFLNDQLQLKVGDFGLATSLAHDHQRRKTVCGTPNYIAPEILEGKKGHSYEVDIWSTGVIVFALLFGKPPFETNEVKTTYDRIKKGEYSFPKSNVSDTAKQFVRKMLVLNPASRATVQELLSDDFLNNCSIPSSLPLSTLACPPSLAFLQQTSQEPQKVLLSYRKDSEHKYNQISSSRTSKESIKGNQWSDKFQSLNHHSNKPRKSERSQASLSRPASSALLTKKKMVSWLREDREIAYLSYGEEQPKYGLFYIQSNQVISMRFNDQTILCSTPALHKFKYITMKDNLEQAAEVFENGGEPEHLQKKMKILQHFTKVHSSRLAPTTDSKADTLQQSLHLLSYKIATHFTLFELSNGTFQAKFKDESDVVIDGEQVHVLRKGKKMTFKAAAVESQPEQVRTKYHHVCSIIKRIKKSKTHAAEEKREKDKENTMAHSSSHTRLVRRVESKPTLQRQFNSTTNLQMPIKRPLQDYSSNNYGSNKKYESATRMKA